MKWKPKVGEKYWIINGPVNELYVMSWFWSGTGIDKRFFKRSNCFRTKKEATAALKRVKKALKGEI